MLKIDGSYGEGGGQLIRTSLALSAITGKSFEAVNIRQGRPNPGLKAQHLHCIRALEKLCSAKSGYAELGSGRLRFLPKTISGKTISVDIRTAGSISLLLQSLLLPAIFADKKVRLSIIGGTCGKWAMPVEYLSNVLVPHLQKFCEKIEIKLLKRGYYPKGGGKVDITIKPKYHLADFKDFNEFYSHVKKEVKDIDLVKQGKLVQIKAISHASRNLEKAEVAERQAKSAKFLLGKYNCPVQLRTEYCDTLSDGSGIVLRAIFSKNDDIDLDNPVIIGSDALGEVGKRAEKVGSQCAEKLIKEIDSHAPVDWHLADNLIPFLIFGGRFKTSSITNHCRTNIWVCEQFLGKIFQIDEESKVISVEK